MLWLAAKRDKGRTWWMRCLGPVPLVQWIKLASPDGGLYPRASGVTSGYLGLSPRILNDVVTDQPFPSASVIFTRN